MLICKVTYSTPLELLLWGSYGLNQPNLGNSRYVLLIFQRKEKERKKDVKELQGIGILPWLSAPHPTPKSSDIVVFSQLFLTLFTASHKVLVSNTEVQQGPQLESSFCRSNSSETKSHLLLLVACIIGP
jgi:hypothetical protein